MHQGSLAGDKVLSRDEKTGVTNVQRVVQTFKRQSARTLKLRFDSGESIETTEEHPFFVEKKGFVPAKWLAVGALAATLHGSSAKLQAVQPVEQSKPVYNFEIEKTHTYFVGHSALWVHNSCIDLISYIDKIPYARRLADGLAGVVQRDVDNLLATFKNGNTNPGIGTRALGNNFFELRGRNAGRVIVKKVNDKLYHIVGKFQGHAGGDTENSATINRLIDEYNAL